MNEDRHWSMVRGLKKPGDLLARSDLCHLHDGRAEAECCAIDDKLQIHLVRIDPNVGGIRLPGDSPINTGRKWA